MNKWFDLHMDTLYELKLAGEDLTSYSRHFSIQNCSDIDKMTVFFAVFVPESLKGEMAFNHVVNHVPYLEDLKARHPVFMDKCKVMLSIENGAGLGGELTNIEALVNMGFRMMTLTWNTGNEIAFGHTKPSGRLTEFGVEVVKEMARVGMVIDLSHINDPGFDDVASVTDRPLVASHSNLRSVYSHTRNLTEDQFREIIKRRGLVGVNLHEPFLGSMNMDAREAVFRHIYRMLELGGENVIAIGSDYDGAEINESLNTPDRLLTLKTYMLDMGLTEKMVNKIFYDNAADFFAREYKKI